MPRSDNTGLNTPHDFIANAHKRIDLLKGALIKRGSWNALTNKPTLASGGVGGSVGDYYVVSHSGVTIIDGVTAWAKNDWIVNSGTKWEKTDNSGGGSAALVTSVNASIGDVVITADSLGLGNVPNESKETILDDSTLTGTTSIDNISFGTKEYTGAGPHNLGVDGKTTNSMTEPSTVNLPPSPANGDTYTVINNSTGSITINSSHGIENIGTSLNLLNRYELVNLRYISGTWYLV